MSLQFRGEGVAGDHRGRRRKVGEGSKDGMEKVPEGWDPGSVSWEGRAHRRVLGESQ